MCHRGGRKPKVEASVHCKGCWIYEEQKENAEVMGKFFGEDSTPVWDYATCYEGCEKRLLEISNKSAERMKKKRKELAVV